jgi:hypothetical protein
MDYRKLLKKYIHHVGSCEGVTFLQDYNRGLSGDIFSNEEWDELSILDKESMDLSDED